MEIGSVTTAPRMAPMRLLRTLPRQAAGNAANARTFSSRGEAKRRERGEFTPRFYLPRAPAAGPSVRKLDVAFLHQLPHLFLLGLDLRGEVLRRVAHRPRPHPLEL